MIHPLFLAGGLVNIALLLFSITRVIKAFHVRDASSFKFYMVISVICLGITVGWTLSYKYFSI